MLDSNRTRFLLLADAADFPDARGGRRLRWNRPLRALTLAPRPQRRFPAGDQAAMRTIRRDVRRGIVDGFGQFAQLEADRLMLAAAGDAPAGPVRDSAGTPLAPETGSYVDATPVGAGRVALGWATATRGGVQIFDLRRRLALDVEGESLLELGNLLRALAADADGRLWALTRNEILEIGGGPMEAAYAPDGTRFEPSTPNPDPLRVLQRFARPAGAQGTNPVFAADSRRLYVVDDTTGDPPAIWTRPIAGAPGVEAWRRLPLVDDDGAPLPFPCDGAALGDDRVALLAVPAAGLDPAGSDVDAAVVEIDEEDGVARLVGERFPLRALMHPRFVRGPSAQIFWRAPDGLRELAALPVTRYASAAATICTLDSGAIDPTWHRLYAEGRIPPGCAVEFWARASDDGLPRPRRRATDPDAFALLADVLAMPPLRAQDRFGGEELRLALERLEFGADWLAAAALGAAPFEHLLSQFDLRAVNPPPLPPLTPEERAAFDAVVARPALARAWLRRMRDAAPGWRDFLAASSDEELAPLAALSRVRNLVRLLADRPLHRQPRPVWSALASEIPFHPGLCDERIPGVAGLFETLLQRSSGSARRLSGRKLDLAIVLVGDGRQTPALRAIRVYAPRFSWQERFLPHHFQLAEDPRPEPARGAAAGADFRERYLAVMEGALTPIEGRIAASERLLDAHACPVEALDWLASYLGGRADPGWPEARRRAYVARLPDIVRARGSFAGVCLEVDVATDGGIARGEVVLVENFRLRRTMATLLGLDLDDADHPLTLGTGESGNSIVGDSLLLSDETAREFLALFAPELARADERAAVKTFFDRHAHQISVVLHGEGRARRRTVEDVLARALPAHVEWSVFETERSFVPGLAPLLGIDSFLELAPEPRGMRLDRSRLGREDLLRDPPALAPERLGGR